MVPSLCETDINEKVEEGGFVEVHNQIATNVKTFQSQKVKRLYDWWLSFAPSPPKKSDFDILNHLHDADGMFLYKVHNRNKYEIRLNGEAAILIMQKHYTGQIITHETTKHDPHLASLIVYLQKIYDNQIPHICTGKFKDHLGRLRDFQSIDCPLVNNNGEVVEIVGILDALD